MLGVVKTDGAYLGVPSGATRVEEGDTLILYGRDGRFAELTTRLADRAGEAAHAEAVGEQEDVAQQDAEACLPS